MTGTIYEASKEVYVDIGGVMVDTGRQHAYLVYDPDGNPSNTSDEQIIRGGDFGQTDIRIQAGVSLSTSDDAMGIGETS